MGKLVRDGIPLIIESRGEVPKTRVLSPGEFTDQLDDKLAEEVDEFLSAGSAEARLEEAADIIEVLLAHVALDGYSPEDLEAIRTRKLHDRGGFTHRIFLEID